MIGVCTTNSYSQEMGLPSPTAASLGEVADQTVNIAVGKPNIRIPLLSVGSGDISLGVSLSYDASGVRVSEVPDWAGSGWTLNTGGVITRSVKGIPDERPDRGYLHNSARHTHLSQYVSNGFTLFELGQTTTAGESVRDILENIEDRTEDGEPDIFYYNFNGNAGKFILGRDGEEPITIPQSDLDIDYSVGTGSIGGETILWFTITTPNGVKYTFDRLEYSIRQPGSSSTTYQPASAWHLTSISSAMGDNTISLSYWPATGHNEVTYAYNNEEHELNATAGDEITYQSHARIYLDTITYKDRNIVFKREVRADSLGLSSGQTEHRLSSIEERNHENTLIREFVLTEEYYSNRLFLKSIQEKDSLGQSLPPHTFDYYKADQLPPRLSRAIDHWGYYNGQEAHNDTMSSFINRGPYYNFGADSVEFWNGAIRDVNTETSKYGVLEKITYPMGGSWSFEYEQNEYLEVIHPSGGTTLTYSAHVSLGGANSLSIQDILAEDIDTDLATPSFVNVVFYYECNGTNMDYNRLYAGGGDDLFINHDYIELLPVVQNPYSCTDFYNHYGTVADKPFLPPSTNGFVRFEKQFQLNISHIDDTLRFSLATQGVPQSIEGDDTIILDYTAEGYRELTFETQSKLSIDRLGPGLRVKSTVATDGINSPVIKTYSYEVPTEELPPGFSASSSGVMYSQPVYSQYHEFPYDSSSGGNPVMAGPTIIPHASFGISDQGLAGYSHVKESVQGGGSTEYRFYDGDLLTEHAEAKMDEFSEYYQLNYTHNNNVLLSDYFGKAYKVVHLSETGDTLSVVRNVENSTDTSSVHTEKKYFAITYDNKLFGGVGSPSANPKLLPYYVSVPFLANTKVTTGTYEGSTTPIRTTRETKYRASTHKNPTRVIETNSVTHEQRITTYQYAHEQDGSSGSPNYSAMADSNMLTQPYSVLVEDSAGNDLSQTWTEWTNNSSISPNSVWRLWKQSVWQGSGTSDVTAAYSEAVTTSVVQTYDAFGNPIEVKDATGALTKAYYGSNGRPFQNATTDTAAINNARGLYITGIQRVLGSDDCTGCGARPTSGDDLFTEGTYDAFGRLTSAKSEDKRAKSYEYDLFGRLTTVRNNAGQQVASYSYVYTDTAFSSTNPNYVVSTTNTTAGNRVSRQYIDGLGRSIQSVAGAGSNVLISEQEYNDRGLAWKAWKPVARSGSGMGYESGFAGLALTEYSDSTAFTENRYEAGSTNRPEKVIPPGGEGSFGSVTTAYSTETLNGDSYSVTTVTDPENRVTKTYTDGWGRAIRTVSDPSGINAITHFVYDELDRLTEVRPPNYHTPPTGSVAGDWVITYAYDVRGNLVSKTSSDFGTARYAYDKAGRLRFSQDANQDSASQVAWTSYDELGRPVQSGIADYTGAFTALHPDSVQSFESAQAYQKGAYTYDGKPSTAAYPWSEFSTEITAFTMDADRARGQLVADMYRMAPEPLPADTAYSGLGIYGAETYQAIDTLTISNTDANSGSTVLFEAGREVRLKPGVTLFSGADVTTRIEPSLAGTDSVGLSPQTGSSPWQLQLYSYDSEGRVAEKKIFTGSRRDWDATISYTYNRLGEVTRRKLAIGEDVLYHHYAYNQLGQLESVTITSDGTADTEPPEITYTYTSDGMVDMKTYKGGTALDHAYNTQGWLTQINDPVDTTHAFSAGYTYFKNGNINEAEFRNPLTSLGAAHQRYKYVHTYDALNRLKTANYSNYSGGWQTTTMFDVDLLTYDKQGNITFLNRYDEAGGLIDELEYEYGKSNRLTRVWDTIAATTEDWDAEDYAFTYDGNGNLASQSGKFSRLTYNEFNLPLQVETTGGHTLKANYNGAGERIFKEYSSASGGSTHTYYVRDGGTTLATIDEAGTLNVNLVASGIEGQLLGGITDAVIDLSGTVSSESESNDTQGTADGPIGLSFTGTIEPANTDWAYFTVLRAGTVTLTSRTDPYDGTPEDLPWSARKNGSTVATGTGTGSFSVTAGTYYIKVDASQGMTGLDYYDINLSAVNASEYATRYMLKDHLGSTRAIVDEIGTHLASYDYYPFGLEMPGRSSSSSNANTDYKFTGYEQEEEEGINLYHAGARGYDPALGRLLQVDRFYHMYPHMSVYQYAANNPVNFIDINGDSVYQITDIAVTRLLGLNNSHHAYLLLVPDDLEAFSESGYADLLQEYSFENENGERVTKQGIIIGAGPSERNPLDLGFLEARTNAGEDPENEQTGTVVIDPGDQTDHEFITSILDNHSNYLDRQQTPGLVPSYSLPPAGEVSPFGSERKANLKGHNSNSYISGIIRASGGVPQNSGRKTPLYNNPVPSHYFLPFKVINK